MKGLRSHNFLIIINRGYEVFDSSTIGSADIMVIENLYTDYNFEKQSYKRKTPDPGFVRYLKEISKEQMMKVVVFEYAPTKAEAIEIAKLALSQGFDGVYVSDIYLEKIGVGLNTNCSNLP